MTLRIAGSNAEDAVYQIIPKEIVGSKIKRRIQKKKQTSQMSQKNNNNYTSSTQAWIAKKLLLVAQPENTFCTEVRWASGI